jgi:hypothetical protein
MSSLMISITVIASSRRGSAPGGGSSTRIAG